MKKILLIVSALLLSAPALAQDAGKVSLPKDLNERMDLARQFHEVHPLKPRIDATIDMLGNGVAPEKRKQYFEDMQKNLDYKRIENASVKAMAETFTQAEIKKMIDYYSSKEGQSIEKKMPDYEKKLQPSVKNALDAAITRIKFGPDSKKK